MDFLETDNDRTSRWVRGADKAANHKKRKNKGTEKPRRTIRHMGSYLQGKVIFLVREKTIFLTGAL
jgi:hypothetical protein